MSRAKLTLMEGEATPRILEILPEKPISIGRSRDNDIIIPKDEHCSRIHARLYFENTSWYVRDFGMNGTRINDEKIDQVSKIEMGDVLRVGDVRFRFNLSDAGNSSSIKALTSDSAAGQNYITAISATRLQMDELSSLCQFMAYTAEMLDPHEMVRHALITIQTQTNSSIVGYLSVDSSEPLTKMVYPDSGTVDIGLSRYLTRQVQRAGKTVWLCEFEPDNGSKTNTESLSDFEDAICVPLQAGGKSIGALHIYSHTNRFADKEVRFCEALAGYLAHRLHLSKERRKLRAENDRLKSHTANDELIGDSECMQKLRLEIERNANHPYTTLILGESGSGKELVAAAIHRKSNRADGPFVCVNCAAIAPNLIEAELFGYRRHAFTGAESDHAGLFEQADEGTLFLDEIGELSQECQSKLLRVIENKTFRPIGATAEKKVDVRILAATNRDLEKEIHANKFKADLYYRLNRLSIHVPPLRDHLEDIRLLAPAFIDKISMECRRNDLQISIEALEELEKYIWPGNVRQLRAILELLVVNSDSGLIGPELVRHVLPKATPTNTEMPSSLKWADLERWSATKALAETNHNVTKAAEMLGISRDTLHNRLNQWGMKTNSREK